MKKFWFSSLVFNAIAMSTTFAWAEARSLETALGIASQTTDEFRKKALTVPLLPQGASGSWSQLELYLFGERSFLGYWQKKSPVLAIMEEFTFDRMRCVDNSCINRRLARFKKLNEILAGAPGRCSSYGSEPQGFGLSRGWGETPLRERWYLLCRNSEDTDWLAYHIFIEYSGVQVRTVEIGLKDAAKMLFCNLTAGDCVTGKSDAPSLLRYY